MSERPLATVEAVVERLVERCAPDRIILFGSHASGRARHDSDIDLVIVTETELRPAQRRMQVERILSDRAVALDLHVYTPAEMRRLYAWGDPFIEEIVDSGRVVYMRRATTAGVRDAREDLDAAEILLGHRKLRPACLHSQQCVEKGLTRSCSTASIADDTRPRLACSPTAIPTRPTPSVPSTPPGRCSSR